MKISTAKPNFDEEFRQKVLKAVGKELTSEITTDFTPHFSVKIFSQDRVIGRYSFVVDKEKKTATLEKQFTIERDYYPFEFCIVEVIRYFRNKKIKNVIW